MTANGLGIRHYPASDVEGIQDFIDRYNKIVADDQFDIPIEQSTPFKHDSFKDFDGLFVDHVLGVSAYAAYKLRHVSNADELFGCIRQEFGDILVDKENRRVQYMDLSHMMRHNGNHHPWMLITWQNQLDGDLDDILASVQEVPFIKGVIVDKDPDVIGNPYQDQGYIETGLYLQNKMFPLYFWLSSQ